MGKILSDHDRQVACGLLGAWFLLVTLAHWNTWSIDMSAVYMAGTFVSAGDWSMAFGAPVDFFSKQVPPEWAAELARYGLEEKFSVPFVYPPIWAWLVAPFAAMTDPMTFFNVARIAMTACFAGSIYVAWRLTRPAALSATAFALLSIVVASLTIPFQFSMDLNQPQALIVLLILLGFLRARDGRDTEAGLWLGIAAAIKISPILLVLIFAAEGRWRVVVISAITAALIALASLVVAGIGPHLIFLERISQIDALVPLIGLNMTFETVMHDFFVPLADYEISGNPLVGVDTPAVSLLSRVLLLLSLGAALWCTRTLEAGTRLWVRLLLVYVAIAFFGPLAWMHYYTLPLLLLPGFAGLWPDRKLVLVGVILLVGFSSPVMEAALDWSLDHDSFEVFYPQHTAFLPLLVFCLLVAVWAARGGKLPWQEAQHPAPSGPLAAGQAD